VSQAQAPAEARKAAPILSTSAEALGYLRVRLSAHESKLARILGAGLRVRARSLPDLSERGRAGVRVFTLLVLAYPMSLVAMWGYAWLLNWIPSEGPAGILLLWCFFFAVGCFQWFAVIPFHSLLSDCAGFGRVSH
jgi:hypothetical protein